MILKEEFKDKCIQLVQNPMGKLAILFLAIWWLFPISFKLYALTNDFYNVIFATEKIMTGNNGNPTWELIGYHAILGFFLTWILIWIGTFISKREY